MLNFAEQTGSGAVIFVWSFLKFSDTSLYIIPYLITTVVYDLLFPPRIFPTTSDADMPEQ
jgi:hypothetical protein